MPKKKIVKETQIKRERQMKILSDGVYEIFDRTPNGSVLSSEVNALLDKIIKG